MIVYIRTKACLPRVELPLLYRFAIADCHKLHDYVVALIDVVIYVR